MGNKALSHDSVFIFESAPGSVAGDTLSQENIPGRVKTLQIYYFWIYSASWKLLFGSLSSSGALSLSQVS
uniref:Uncharacterized protein n=1 Tax=Buteo japonicus TaxID=224669 RepID=A0A8C0B7H9_9AVES